jgi:hypothetical protein
LFQNVNLKKNQNNLRKELVNTGEKCKGSYKDVFLVTKVKKRKKNFA